MRRRSPLVLLTTPLPSTSKSWPETRLCSYEGDPMRLLFSKSASPHHGFAAYYTYLEKIFGVRSLAWLGLLTQRVTC